MLYVQCTPTTKITGLNYISNTAGVLLQTGTVLPFKTSWGNFRFLVRSLLLIVFCIVFLSLDCLFLLSSSFFFNVFVLFIYTSGQNKDITKYFTRLLCL